jgi:hypothetical protein
MTVPAEGSFLHRPAAAYGKPICRLGLASHDGSSLTVADVHHALDRGVNFLNWAGSEDTISQAVAGLGRRREDVVVCVQFGARTAVESGEELRSILSALGSDYVDVVTFYYVESAEEWSEIVGPGGALAYCRDACRAGQIRRLGVTTHQRPLGAAMVQSRLLDVLMIRYNAAHRGGAGSLSRRYGGWHARDRLHGAALGRACASNGGRSVRFHRAFGAGVVPFRAAIASRFRRPGRSAHTSGIG